MEIHSLNPFAILSITFEIVYFFKITAKKHSSKAPRKYHVICSNCNSSFYFNIQSIHSMFQSIKNISNIRNNMRHMYTSHTRLRNKCKSKQQEKCFEKSKCVNKTVHQSHFLSFFFIEDETVMHTIQNENTNFIYVLCLHWQNDRKIE